MTRRKVTKVKETTGHSFEDVLGVPHGSTELTKTQVSTELVPHEDYDDKDDEIESDISGVHDRGLELFEYLMEEIEDAEPSNRADLVTVAIQTLNTMLSAADKKRLLKQHSDLLKQKDRSISSKEKSGGKTTNNLFVGSREEVLEMLEEIKNSPKEIEEDDASIVDVQEQQD